MGAKLQLAPLLALLAGAAQASIPIHGKVVADGGPLAGATVQLLPARADYQRGVDELAGRTLPEPVGTAETGENGHFELAAPQAGLWVVLVEADGFVPMEHLLWPLVEVKTLPPLELSPDRPMIVSVRGPTGEPVAGATVAARSDSPWLWRTTGSAGRGWRAAMRRAVTGQDGRARLPRAESEALFLRGFAPGLAEADEAAVDGSRGTLSLGAGQPVTIRASLGGRPVPEALVLVGSYGWATGVTNDDGVLEAVLPAAATVRVISPTAAFGTAHLAAEDDDLEVELAAARRLYGRVVSADRRRPLAGAVVWSGRAIDSFMQTDGDGRFNLREDPHSESRYLQAAAPSHFNEWQQLGADGEQTLALRPAAAAAGRVVDERGEPLSGAEVTARALPGDGSFRRQGDFRARSGGDGSFQLPRLVPEVGLRIVADADGYAPAELELSALAPRQIRSGLELVLTRGAELSGYVLGDGAAVAGAELSLWRRPEGSMPAAMVELDPFARPLQATSTVDGGFTYNHLAPGGYRLKVRAAGFAPLTVPGIEVAAGGTDLGELRLEPGVEVTGQVVDGDGRPLAGTRIHAVPVEGFGFGGIARPGVDEPTAVSAADGSFVIGDRRRGERLDLSAALEGYGSGKAPGVEAPNDRPVTIVLERSARISGVVVDPEGSPVADARIWASVREGGSRGRVLFSSGQIQSQTASRADGSFELDDVPPGAITIGAAAQGWRQAELDELEIAAGSEVEGLRLELRRGATISGQVLTAEGTPATGIFVQLEDANRRGMVSGGFARSDGEGRYTLEGVELGTHMVVARDEAGKRAAREVEVEPGSNQLDLRFRAGQPLSGRVLDEGGAPLAGATVHLLTSAESWRGTEARSGEDGGFRFEDVEDGDYLLRAARPGYAIRILEDPVRVAGAPVSGIELRLSRGGAIGGRIFGLEDRELGEVQLMAASPPGQWARGIVRHDGSYRIDSLAAGDWHVQAMLPGGRQTSGRVTVEADGAEAILDLDFGGGFTVSGRVTSAGEPLAGLSVMASGIDVQDWAAGTTDHSGRFRLNGLKAGHHRLQVTDLRSGFHHVEELQLDGDREVEIEIATGSIAGLVLDGGDLSPLADASVTLEPEAEAGIGIVLPPTFGNPSDRQGRFRIARVAAGSYRVRAVKDGYAPAESAITVEPGAEVAGVELRLEPSGGLRLLVRGPSGAPPSEVGYALLDDAGRTLTQGRRPADDSGLVRLPSVPAGSFDLLLSGAGTAVRRLWVTVPGPPVEVRLEHACRLEISVPALAGEEILAMATLTAPDGRPHHSMRWVGVLQKEWPLVLGRATVEGLAPGSYEVQVTAPDGRAWQGRVTVAPGGLNRISL